MIIKDLNHLEVVDAKVEGSSGYPTYFQYDKIVVDFNSYNNFATYVNSPYTLTNSAAAGAKGEAYNGTYLPTYSFTKADTVSYAEYLGSSFSASTSAAVINSAFIH